jgi:hypothetical protein
MKVRTPAAPLSYKTGGAALSPKINQMTNPFVLITSVDKPIAARYPAEVLIFQGFSEPPPHAFECR